MARVCPITREQFTSKARSKEQTFIVEPKEFSTGSFGWHHQGKTTMDVDGTPVDVQVNVLMTVIGSKKLD